jgi:hypothetical protein
MVPDICHLSYMKGINKRTTVQADLGKTRKPYLKNKSKKGWGHSSSGRITA